MNDDHHTHSGCMGIIVFILVIAGLTQCQAIRELERMHGINVKVEKGETPLPHPKVDR